eukprot:CAMPEP_0198149946 /NCGR_PEP_ID=MMETSP1443-20131203/48729_1 /TAXON_ID=186043 /ORGANISM="Entomoneis sp., Strain CCMP2396" /LENGTH=155 /DNA_ID=CAMNT_0043815117 /DNA_START=288 /DNA_END=755 /DNA_ORIENTATION=+
MPGGRGEEWIEFQLVRGGGGSEGEKKKRKTIEKTTNQTPPSCSMVRLSAISISIPPMPQGPLSVREFCLHAHSSKLNKWHAVTRVFEVASTPGWQRFALHESDDTTNNNTNTNNRGLDVDKIRLVCLSNQMARRTDHFGRVEMFDSVGFFSVRFE